MIQSWLRRGGQNPGANISLARTNYYDALDVELSEQTELKEYCRAVELLPDTHLGFGWLRAGGKRSRRQQKAVDTLIAVDMVVGAFTGLFRVAILVAGDAGFVPVVEEVRRRGVMVTVVGGRDSLSDDLRRSADRSMIIGLDTNGGIYAPMSYKS